MSSVLPDSCTWYGPDSGTGSTAATALASFSARWPSGPLTCCRRNRWPSPSTSTMTQAASSLASSLAYRCNATGSL